MQQLLTTIETEMKSKYATASSSADHTPAVTLRRALEALNAILKEFVSMKMMAGIKVMGSVRRHLSWYRAPP